jgi:hypothetical protein
MMASEHTGNRLINFQAWPSLNNKKGVDMALKEEQNTCAHTGCNCPIAQDEKYCSPHCEAAPTEVICGCGHAQCQAAAAAPAAG